MEELGLHAAVATHLGTRASHRGGRMVSGQQGWDGEDLAEEAKHERKCHHARVAKEGCPQGVRVKKRKMGGAYRPKSEWGPFTCTNWSSLRGGGPKEGGVGGGPGMVFQTRARSAKRCVSRL